MYCGQDCSVQVNKDEMTSQACNQTNIRRLEEELDVAPCILVLMDCDAPVVLYPLFAPVAVGV